MHDWMIGALIVAVGLLVWLAISAWVLRRSSEKKKG